MEGSFFLSLERERCPELASGQIGSRRISCKVMETQLNKLKSASPSEKRFS
jgi:hypothetical protein